MTEKIVLKDAFKKVTDDQDKILPPETTVQQIKTKLAQLDLDLLREAVRIDQGRLDIPVFISYCGRDASAMTGTKKQMGKGATPQQAEASAVMELVERYSFFSFARNPGNFVTQTYRHINEPAIPFELIAQSVHDDSDDLSISRDLFETLPLQWTWAYNLTRDQKMLIPFNWFYAINEFNGPSAGNCVEEALVQGICELVERHTSALISHRQIKTPAINPASVRLPLVKEMLSKYKNAGIELFMTDFTLNMGIPSAGVLAYDPTTFPEKSEIVWTAGTAPDPEKALSRALTEVAQLAGDFNTSANYVASGLPKFKRLNDALFVTQTGETINIDTMPNISNSNLRVEVENCIAALAKHNLEVFVIDTMQSHLKIPAFYTIIPGAHFRERSIGTSVGLFGAKLITETQSADSAIRRLLEFNSNLSGKYYTQFYLGLCFLKKDEPETALKWFESALELSPPIQEMATIYSYMGQCLKAVEQYRRAISVLRKGEQCDNERTDIYNLMGFCHFKLKEHDAAIESFKRVIQLDPGSAIDYANIASNYREIGEKQKAIQYYIMALELDPSITFARKNLESLQQIT